MLLFETVKNLIFLIVTRVSTRDYTVNHHLKANFWKKIQFILAGNSNLGHSHLITTVSQPYNPSYGSKALCDLNDFLLLQRLDKTGLEPEAWEQTTSISTVKMFNGEESTGLTAVRLLICTWILKNGFWKMDFKKWISKKKISKNGCQRAPFLVKFKTLWEGHKIWKNLPPVLTKRLFLLSSVKTSGKFFQSFVTFSEKLDFIVCKIQIRNRPKMLLFIFVPKVKPDQQSVLYLVTKLSIFLNIPAFWI